MNASHNPTPDEESRLDLEMAQSNLQGASECAIALLKLLQDSMSHPQGAVKGVPEGYPVQVLKTLLQHTACSLHEAQDWLKSRLEEEATTLRPTAMRAAEQPPEAGYQAIPAPLQPESEGASGMHDALMELEEHTARAGGMTALLQGYLLHQPNSGCETSDEEANDIAILLNLFHDHTKKAYDEVWKAYLRGRSVERAAEEAPKEDCQAKKKGK